MINTDSQNRKLFAYIAGEEIRIAILKHGFTISILKLFRNIIEGHSDEIVSVFWEGLSGVGNNYEK